MALRTAERTLSPVDVALRVGIVGLALATGYIHSTLGGLLFTLNAVGYLVAAVAMVIPLSLAVALSNESSRNSAWRCLASGPWQKKQFSERMG